MEKLRSFIATGASASGKTTLVRHAHSLGYNVLATHTTRPLRPGEVQGLDAHSVSEADFIDNFNQGIYLEPNLAFARLDATGIYYGTPRRWLSSLATQGSCAMPTSLTVAKAVKDNTGVAWVHLECPNDVRRQRLEARGVPTEEVDARMISGESVHVPEDAEFILDTSEFAVAAIFNTIKDIL